jgi:hypothetical protein
MMINYSLILERKYPNSLWNLNGDEYDGLDWVSDTPKPSKKTLDALWDQVKKEIEVEADAKIKAKAAAQSKLTALGLTVEDLTALGL